MDVIQTEVEARETCEGVKCTTTDQAEHLW